MLFADRGVKITQQTIEEASFAPIDAIDLAAVLNKLEPSQTRLWLGGAFVVPGSDKDLIRELNRSGSWAAVLWERRASIGHLVVVNGLNEKGRVIVRDPWDGTMYTMEIQDFLSVWLRTGIYSKRKRA
jgi:filamentous hemagglutinin